MFKFNIFCMMVSCIFVSVNASAQSSNESLSALDCIHVPAGEPLPTDRVYGLPPHQGFRISTRSDNGENYRRDDRVVYTTIEIIKPAEPNVNRGIGCRTIPLKENEANKQE